MIQMPWATYVLYHSEFSDGECIFNMIYQLLCRDIEKPLTDGIDIPAVYTSATANAVSKKQQQQQPVQQTYTPPTSAPQLNVTESQITGVNLFNI